MNTLMWALITSELRGDKSRELNREKLFLSTKSVENDQERQIRAVEHAMVLLGSAKARRRVGIYSPNWEEGLVG
jgi:hypothetical protein